MLTVFCYFTYTGATCRRRTNTLFFFCLKMLKKLKWDLTNPFHFLQHRLDRSGGGTLTLNETTSVRHATNMTGLSFSSLTKPHACLNNSFSPNRQIPIQVFLLSSYNGLLACITDNERGESMVWLLHHFANK